MTAARLFLRAALALVAAVVLAAPFVIAWRILRPGSDLSPQHGLLAAPADASSVDRWRALAAGLPADAAPVALAYHDVRPGSTDPYVVSPQELDEQLTALETAGYTTITTAQYVAYLKGGPVPPRSVYLTFDDGTAGLWEYADKVLADHHAHAAAFLITGEVSRPGPYYLSWDEVTRMSKDGHWDFQGHTNAMHTRVPTGPGKVGSRLTNLTYDPATGTYETEAAHEAAVTADFDTMFADFAAHGLTAPSLFAYPFSEVTEPANNPAPANFVRGLLARRFVAALTNKVKSPAPTSRRAAAGRQEARLEVVSTTTADDLVQRVVSWTAIPPAGTWLTDTAHWTELNGQKSGVYRTLVGDATPVTGYSVAYYAPEATADWTDYTVSATITRLAQSGDTATVVLRTGSSRPLVVRVSHSTVQVADVTTGAKLVERALAVPPAAGRPLSISVTPSATTVEVDGKVRITVPSTGGPAATGGIGLALSHRAGKTAAAFTGLRVTALG